MKKDLFIGIIIGAIVFGSITGVFAYSYAAKDIEYTPRDTTWKVNNVSDAIKDLKDIKTNRENGVEVATLTTQGATYTMQNDGYILGTVRPECNVYTGQVFLDNIVVYNALFDECFDWNASIYAKKGSVVKTRSNHGSYNLTVYEWK